MATFSSTVSILLLLSAIVTSGTPTVIEEKVKAACEGTPHPETCFSILSPSINASNPDAADACPLARLALERADTILIKVSDEIHYLCSNETDKSNPKELPEDMACLESCASKMITASDVISGNENDLPERVTIGRVRRFITDAQEKKLVWNCDGCRHGEAHKKVEELVKKSSLEEFMEIMYVLVGKIPARQEC